MLELPGGQPFSNMEVRKRFQNYPKKIRDCLMHLRNLIWDEAQQVPEVGNIEETLKWGQPAYLTSQTGSGTTIRIDQLKSPLSHYGLFVHCQTSLISTYKDLYSDCLEFDRNRAIILNSETSLPESQIRHCIALALTYHLKK